MRWESELYESKHDFVAEYGKGLLQYLPDEKEISLLDLGCGTGTLTNDLSKKYARIMGIDGSSEMIEKAKESYPHLSFDVVDALGMTYENDWDIVFSNAVFHWIPNHELLVKKIKQVLKPEGKLVCEFGGFGNIETIQNAFQRILESKGYDYQSPFNFSTKEAFETALEENGFVIEELTLYDRPTILKDGSQGLYNWVVQFFESDLSHFNPIEQKEILNELEEEVRQTLWNGEHWIADYKRLRAIAHL